MVRPDPPAPLPSIVIDPELTIALVDEIAPPLFMVKAPATVPKAFKLLLLLVAPVST